MAQDRGLLAGCCKLSNKPSDSIKGEEFLTSSVTVGFSKRILLCEISYLFVRVRNIETMKFPNVHRTIDNGHLHFTMRMGCVGAAQFSEVFNV